MRRISAILKPNVIHQSITVPTDKFDIGKFVWRIYFIYTVTVLVFWFNSRLFGQSFKQFFLIVRIGGIVGILAIR